MKDKFLYETHMHTIEGSACGRTYGADYIAAYMKKGYAGIIITDHFFNGNCAVDRSLPWEEKIDLYCKGYENAYEAAQGKDFDVIFGIEYNCGGDEYLLYGPDKAWLKAHPEMESWDYKTLLEEVHKIGGIVIQAHPFRDRDYIPRILVNPLFSDGFEGYNRGNDDYSDQYAFRYAEQHGIKCTSGSDMHNVNLLDDRTGGVVLPRRIQDSKEYAKIFKTAKRSVPFVLADNGECEQELGEDEIGFVTYADRIVPSPEALFEHPMFVINEKQVAVPVTTKTVLEW